ncbi:sex-determining region Y protein-like isoform X3 [Hippocampus zosterae]|uniref:sex-determining region Y protein-like isoform X3 n=1 Tax=Hippocampus zosterae TaxID=109293 RepID=UPI00223CE9CF|nr:sex-determining region Y protein-like isoform X3 [Hippocampus zosterae]
MRSFLCVKHTKTKTKKVKKKNCCTFRGHHDAVNVTPAAVNQMPAEALIKRKTAAQDSTGPYIKKPLNAFMLFMKEQRPVVKAQFLHENSAAVNKIMGQMWKSLSLEQQQKYYEESERLNRIHASTYPGWSCSDNYVSPLFFPSFSQKSTNLSNAIFVRNARWFLLVQGKKKKRVWGSAATGFNNRSTPAPELPALVRAPSASSCNWHEAPQVEPTSVPFTLGASLVTYVPLSSSPSPASSCPTYTRL